MCVTRQESRYIESVTPTLLLMACLFLVVNALLVVLIGVVFGPHAFCLRGLSMTPLPLLP